MWVYIIGIIVILITIYLISSATTPPTTTPTPPPTPSPTVCKPYQQTACPDNWTSVEIPPYRVCGQDGTYVPGFGPSNCQVECRNDASGNTQYPCWNSITSTGTCSVETCPCSSDSDCLNDGTCSSGVCVCKQGYSGIYCQINDETTCAPSNCSTLGGSCKDGNTCECNDGWEDTPGMRCGGCIHPRGPIGSCKGVMNMNDLYLPIYQTPADCLDPQSFQITDETLESLAIKYYGRDGEPSSSTAQMCPYGPGCSGSCSSKACGTKNDDQLYLYYAYFPYGYWRDVSKPQDINYTPCGDVNGIPSLPTDYIDLIRESNIPVYRNI